MRWKYLIFDHKKESINNWGRIFWQLSGLFVHHVFKFLTWVEFCGVKVSWKKQYPVSFHNWPTVLCMCGNIKMICLHIHVPKWLANVPGMVRGAWLVIPHQTPSQRKNPVSINLWRNNILQSFWDGGSSREIFGV